MGTESVEDGFTEGGGALDDAAEAGEASGFAEGEATFEVAGDEVEMADFAVVVAHEPFDATGEGTVVVAEVMGDGGLEGAGEDIVFAGLLVVEFVADAEEEVVGAFELPPGGAVEEFASDEIAEVGDVEPDGGHPTEVLVVAESAAAALHIGFEEAVAVAPLGAAFLLILEPFLDVGLFASFQAAVLEDDAHLGEEAPVAPDLTGLDEGGPGVHAAVGFADAVVEVADHRVAFESDGPEEGDELFHERTDERTGLVGAAVVEDGDVEVAMGIEFGATVAAEGDDGEGFGGEVGGEGGAVGVEGVLEEEIDHFGAGAADFATSAAGAMEDAQALGFDLEEAAEAVRFLAGQAAGWEAQAGVGACRQLFGESGHGGRTVEEGAGWGESGIRKRGMADRGRPGS